MTKAATPDHKTFLASVPAQDRIALTARSDRAGLRHLALHLGLILITGTLIAAKVPFWAILLPVQGILIVFLFTLEHECTHKTPFANPALNDGIGHIIGVALLLPFRWFRAFHLAHHRWTNQPGLDPELDGPKPDTVRVWTLHVSGIPYWASQSRLILDLARGRGQARYINTGSLPAMRTEARVMLVLYLLALLSLLHSPVLLWVWIVPVLLGQPFLRLYLLAEHGDCPFVTDMFRNSRTILTTAAIRFLAWNMPYHTEHHVWPAVPFHQLPVLHRAMKSHLRVTADGYGAFSRDYLARIRTTAKGSNP